MAVRNTLEDVSFGFIHGHNDMSFNIDISIRATRANRFSCGSYNELVSVDFELFKSRDIIMWLEFGTCWVGGNTFIVHGGGSRVRCNFNWFWFTFSVRSPCTSIDNGTSQTLWISLIYEILTNSLPEISDGVFRSDNLAHRSFVGHSLRLILC